MGCRRMTCGLDETLFSWCGYVGYRRVDHTQTLLQQGSTPVSVCGTELGLRLFAGEIISMVWCSGQRAVID